MASVNKVILIGNLGRDPEVRYTPSGAAVCNLRIATTRNWKNKDSGEKMEETEWHSVVLYDRQAEVAGDYLKTEIVADSMQLLGGREGAGGGAADEGGARPAAPAQRPAGKPAAKSSTGFDDMDDDIPF
jgi:single-strand DNA-binding protein